VADNLFRLNGTADRDPGVDAWLAAPHDELRRMVEPWFEQVRGLGPDVRECLHDHCPTACVDDAAFAYVNAFKAHAAVGFFYGADLADPAGLLEGSGKRMRHVKLVWGRPVDQAALGALIATAYQDIRRRLENPGED
jgi:hypothetical protein